jgi:hypothetical protein
MVATAILGFAVQWLGLTVYPYHTRYTDPFAWRGSFLVQHVRVLLREGADDMWLWSAARGARAYNALFVLFALVALWAARGLWRRAECPRERIILAAFGGGTALLLIARTVLDFWPSPWTQSSRGTRDGEASMLPVAPAVRRKSPAASGGRTTCRPLKRVTCWSMLNGLCDAPRVSCLKGPAPWIRYSVT